MELLIERLGTDGAGIASHHGRLIAIPMTLPGERVRVALGDTKSAPEILAASPERADPPCRHFGDCGGCTLQHLAAAPYAEFKRQLIVDALARVGLRDVDVRPTVIGRPASRRRATLKVFSNGRDTVLGISATREHRIVDLAECPILVPALQRLLAPLRRFIAELLPAGSRASIELTASESGVDAGLVLPNPIGLEQLEKSAFFADEQELARLWWRNGSNPPSPIAERRRPIVRFGEIPVTLPYGTFLQASLAGEAAMIDCARQALANSPSVADLFAGIGTFTLSLANTHAVHAVEGDQAAVAALSAAIRTSMLSRCTVEKRDLDAKPLTAPDLARFDAVLFDPPRAGAAAQSRELAISQVPLVVAVSCNPATFARDAAILIKGGYQIETVVPIDQFFWSSHIELVAILRRRDGN